jgi:hypothetical protein
MEGGHTVPIEKILSRYVRSMTQLSTVIQIADRVYVYDNSVDGTEARLCLRTHDGRLRKVYGDLPACGGQLRRKAGRWPQADVPGSSKGHRDGREGDLRSRPSMTPGRQRPARLPPLPLSVKVSVSRRPEPRGAPWPARAP